MRQASAEVRGEQVHMLLHQAVSYKGWELFVSFYPQLVVLFRNLPPSLPATTAYQSSY